MSGIAGILLMIYGAAAAYVGFNEVQHPHLLTHVVAFSSLGIGAALVAAGLAHFVAPHKAYLMSLPMLVYFHVQSVVVASFLFEGNPRWLYQGCLAVVSIVILILSYKGYKASQAKAFAQ